MALQRRPTNRLGEKESKDIEWVFIRYDFIFFGIRAALSNSTYRMMRSLGLLLLQLLGEQLHIRRMNEYVILLELETPNFFFESLLLIFNFPKLQFFHQEERDVTEVNSPLKVFQ